jgi:tRNA 5-methylaminomethyl-2-thiouridine biosynthesis bifunctional protein
MKVGIVGGGLAGCALAYVLRLAGAEPVIYEAEQGLGAKASGNSLGLYNPRLSAHRNAQSDYFAAAFSLLTRQCATFYDIDWNPCGALHLAFDEKRGIRYAQTIETWGWEQEHMQLLDADAASDVAGVALPFGGIYLPEAGSVSPHKLCQAYARGVEVHYGQNVDDLTALDVDVVVLACAHGARAHADWLPLSTVRGQVSDVQASARSKKLKCALCYKGYIAPANDYGVHSLGATFQRWLDHDDAIVEDNADNIAKLAAFAPDLVDGFKVVGHRAGLRTSTRDYFPIVGRMPDRDGVYITAGHGSHGVVSSFMAAHLLADMILDRPYALARDTVAALSPARFL